MSRSEYSVLQRRSSTCVHRRRNLLEGEAFLRFCFFVRNFGRREISSQILNLDVDGVCLDVDGVCQLQGQGRKVMKDSFPDTSLRVAVFVTVSPTN